MAMESCSLSGTVTLNGSPTAATITATPKLPGPVPAPGLTVPTSKSISVPGTGVVPATPALDAPGGPGTWPGRGVEYELVVTVAGAGSYKQSVFVSRGDTLIDLGHLIFTLNVDSGVQSSDVRSIVVVTEEQYEAIVTPDPDTLYVVSG